MVRADGCNQGKGTLINLYTYMFKILTVNTFLFSCTTVYTNITSRQVMVYSSCCITAKGVFSAFHKLKEKPLSRGTDSVHHGLE